MSGFVLIVRVAFMLRPVSVFPEHRWDLESAVLSAVNCSDPCPRVVGGVCVRSDLCDVAQLASVGILR